MTTMFWLLAALSLSATQPSVTPLSRTEALQQDANHYALQHQINPGEALRRLRAQQQTVPATAAIAREFAPRLAGIAIEHSPEYRIVVLLTGSEPVADRSAEGVPITFRTGAQATRDQALWALRRHLIDLRRELPGARGAGYDQRTGEIVLLIRRADAQNFGVVAIQHYAQQLGGVPVRVEINDIPEINLRAEGGGRLEGLLPNGKRGLCTAGFAVTDGQRDAIATAAHCPDEMSYRDSAGALHPLPFLGHWGLGYHDVQINLSPEPLAPRFYSDRRAGALRPLESWRNLAGIRAGDFVCHWGETSGYSCGEVQLTDYAPPGALCGGPCTPMWVTVAGAACQPGDSGGPVFVGTIAVGIMKGANRLPASKDQPEGRCNFYYFMSTDLLPPPWRLLHSGESAAGLHLSPKSPM